MAARRPLLSASALALAALCLTYASLPPHVVGQCVQKLPGVPAAPPGGVLRGPTPQGFALETNLESAAPSWDVQRGASPSSPAGPRRGADRAEAATIEGIFTGAPVNADDVSHKAVILRGNPTGDRSHTTADVGFDVASYSAVPCKGPDCAEATTANGIQASTSVNADVATHRDVIW